MRLPRGLLVAAMCAAVATNQPSASARATFGEYFAGEVAAGVVMLDTPHQPLTFLGFAVQTSVPGTVRMTTYVCDGRDPCVFEVVTAPGSVALVGAALTLSVRHPRLGRIQLRSIAEPGTPDQATCHVSWRPSRAPAAAFGYSATGLGERARWSGRVGAARTALGDVIGCGVYEQQGVVTLSRG